MLWFDGAHTGNRKDNRIAENIVLWRMCWFLTIHYDRTWNCCSKAINLLEHQLLRAIVEQPTDGTAILGTVPIAGRILSTAEESGRHGTHLGRDAGSAARCVSAKTTRSQGSGPTRRKKAQRPLSEARMRQARQTALQRAASTGPSRRRIWISTSVGTASSAPSDRVPWYSTGGAQRPRGGAVRASTEPHTLRSSIAMVE
jgi:hypothetical protein